MYKDFKTPASALYAYAAPFTKGAVGLIYRARALARVVAILEYFATRGFPRALIIDNFRSVKLNDVIVLG